MIEHWENLSKPCGDCWSLCTKTCQSNVCLRDVLKDECVSTSFEKNLWTANVCSAQTSHILEAELKVWLYISKRWYLCVNKSNSRLWEAEPGFEASSLSKRVTFTRENRSWISHSYEKKTQWLVIERHLCAVFVEIFCPCLYLVT